MKDRKFTDERDAERSMTPIYDGIVARWHRDAEDAIQRERYLTGMAPKPEFLKRLHATAHFGIPQHNCPLCLPHMS